VREKLFTVSFSCRFPPVLSPVSSYFSSIPTTLVYAITPEHNHFSPYFLSVFFFLSFYSLLGFLLPFFNYTLLSMSFSLFFFFPFFYSIPFSHMSILGTRTTRAFNPSFLILQTGKIPAGYGSVLFNFFFVCT